MKRLLKYAVFILAAVLVLLPFTKTDECQANAAEPPSIFIIVPNAPDDLQITLIPDGINARKTSKSFETYFSFYLYDLQGTSYTFQVTTGGEVFEIELDKPVNTYNNIYTLNLEKQTLTLGKSTSRSALLIFSRVAFTLIIEGLLFFLFGYRHKRSWLVFIVVNLLTQLTLWISLNGTLPFQAAYVILSLFFAEVLIFIIEMLAFLILVNEHRRLRTAAYVIIANVLSLLAGIFLITTLPI